MASVGGQRLRGRGVLPQALTVLLILGVLLPCKPSRALAHGASVDDECEVVALVMADRLVVTALADPRSIPVEGYLPSQLPIVPLGLRLCYDFEGFGERDLTTLSVVAPLEGSRLPSMETSIADSEFSAELKSFNLSRLVDQLFRSR